MWVFSDDHTHFCALQHLLGCLWGLPPPQFNPFLPELIFLWDCAVQRGDSRVDEAGVNELLLMEE